MITNVYTDFYKLFKVANVKLSNNSVLSNSFVCNSTNKKDMYIKENKVEDFQNRFVTFVTKIFQQTHCHLKRKGKRNSLPEVLYCLKRNNNNYKYVIFNPRKLILKNNPFSFILHLKGVRSLHCN